MAQEYSVCEIEQNNGRNGKPVWLIIKGSVYDVTKFLKEHPGGEETILEHAGKDATKAFNEVGHSTDATKELKVYKIGVVRKECTEVINNQPTATTKSIAPAAKQLPNGESSRETQKETHSFFCCC